MLRSHVWIPDFRQTPQRVRALETDPISIATKSSSSFVLSLGVEMYNSVLLSCDDRHIFQLVTLLFHDP
uniref:Uncharacterized protein n=1 Tax=Daphnia magna TaxID=35525 RepID=A0A0N8DJ82_9CRUS